MPIDPLSLVVPSPMLGVPGRWVESWIICNTSGSTVNSGLSPIVISSGAVAYPGSTIVLPGDVEGTSQRLKVQSDIQYDIALQIGVSGTAGQQVTAIGQVALTDQVSAVELYTSPPVWQGAIAFDATTGNIGPFAFQQRGTVRCVPAGTRLTFLHLMGILEHDTGATLTILQGVIRARCVPNNDRQDIQPTLIHEVGDSYKNSGGPLAGYQVPGADAAAIIHCANTDTPTPGVISFTGSVDCSNQTAPAVNDPATVDGVIMPHFRSAISNTVTGGWNSHFPDYYTRFPGQEHNSIFPNQPPQAPPRYIDILNIGLETNDAIAITPVPAATSLANIVTLANTAFTFSPIPDGAYYNYATAPRYLNGQQAIKVCIRNCPPVNPSSYPLANPVIVTFNSLLAAQVATWKGQGKLVELADVYTPTVADARWLTQWPSPDGLHYPPSWYSAISGPVQYAAIKRLGVRSLPPGVPLLSRFY